MVLQTALSHGAAGRRWLDGLTPLILDLERDWGINVCTTLERLWSLAPGEARLPSGAEKGRWLADDIARAWEELDRPCSARVIDRALSFAENRIAKFDVERAVLVHGDAHGWNTLEE